MRFPSGGNQASTLNDASVPDHDDGIWFDDSKLIAEFLIALILSGWLTGKPSCKPRCFTGERKFRLPAFGTVRLGHNQPHPNPACTNFSRAATAEAGVPQNTRLENFGDWTSDLGRQVPSFMALEIES